MCRFLRTEQKISVLSQTAKIMTPSCGCGLRHLSSRSSPPHIKAAVLLFSFSPLQLCLSKGELREGTLGPRTFQTLGPSTFQTLGPRTFQTLGPRTFQTLGPRTFQTLGPRTFQTLGPSTFQTLGPSTFQTLGPSTFPHQLLSNSSQDLQPALQIPGRVRSNLCCGQKSGKWTRLCSLYCSLSHLSLVSLFIHVHTDTTSVLRGISSV